MTLTSTNTLVPPVEDLHGSVALLPFHARLQVQNIRTLQWTITLLPRRQTAPLLYYNLMKAYRRARTVMPLHFLIFNQLRVSGSENLMIVCKTLRNNHLTRSMDG